jgi:hypothetical protein
MARWETHRSDASEPVIVQAMEQAGASVRKIGRPVDLLVACKGQTAVAEVKTGNAKLEPDQASFLAAWPGVSAVLRTPQDGLDLVQQLKQLARKVA